MGFYDECREENYEHRGAGCDAKYLVFFEEFGGSFMFDGLCYDVSFCKWKNSASSAVVCRNLWCLKLMTACE